MCKPFLYAPFWTKLISMLPQTAEKISIDILLSTQVVCLIHKGKLHMNWILKRDWSCSHAIIQDIIMILSLKTSTFLWISHLINLLACTIWSEHLWISHTAHVFTDTFILVCIDNNVRTVINKILFQGLC